MEALKAALESLKNLLAQIKAYIEELFAQLKGLMPTNPNAD